jgi:hypothetical protein
MSPRTHYYEICLEEQLDDHWEAWFSDMEFIPLDVRTCPGTVMRGKLTDQAALFGLLEKIRDLGLTLIEVRRLEEISQNKENRRKA